MNNLREKLKPYKRPRPFICDGNPLNCEVFIVGINAATEMQNDFWSFWTQHVGFDKARWFESYILERQSKPLKPNKTRRNKLSNTRQRIEWITESLKPIKTLETNLFMKATPTAAELKSRDRQSEVFEFLLKTIKPRLIFIHGNEVIKYIEKLYGIAISKNKLDTYKILGTETNLLAMQHLSRGWGRQKSLDLGIRLKSELKERI